MQRRHGTHASVENTTHLEEAAAAVALHYVGLDVGGDGWALHALNDHIRGVGVLRNNLPCLSVDIHLLASARTAAPTDLRAHIQNSRHHVRHAGLAVVTSVAGSLGAVDAHARTTADRGRGDAKGRTQGAGQGDARQVRVLGLAQLVACRGDAKESSVGGQQARRGGGQGLWLYSCGTRHPP